MRLINSGRKKRAKVSLRGKASRGDKASECRTAKMGEMGVVVRQIEGAEVPVQS